MTVSKSLNLLFACSALGLLLVTSLGIYIEELVHDFTSLCGQVPLGDQS